MSLRCIASLGRTSRISVKRMCSGDPRTSSSISRFMVRKCPSPRYWWHTTRWTPLACAAAIMSSASGKFSAMGFSQSTCLPASAAATARSLWKQTGVQTLTTSTLSWQAASCQSAWPFAPSCDASLAHRWWSGSHTTTIFASGCCSPGQCMFAAHVPASEDGDVQHHAPPDAISLSFR